MPNDADALRKLDELLDAEDGLTAWEMDFIESLNTQRGRTFTNAQAEKLDQIFERVCG